MIQKKRHQAFLDRIDALRTERAADHAELVTNLRDIAGAPMTEKAAEIIRLGKIRRGEIVDERTLPPKGSTAWKILNSARKRDGLEPLK
jgi:hypothetical protein